MMMVETYLDRSPLGGIGVFARKTIPLNAVVWELNPLIDRVVPLSTINALPGIQRDYVVSHSSFDGQDCLLCYDQGTFINYSLTPNTRIEGDRTIAVRQIEAGEELTENYHEYDQEGPDRINGRYAWETP